jgi:hypothetical protein
MEFQGIVKFPIAKKISPESWLCVFFDSFWRATFGDGFKGVDPGIDPPSVCQ